MSSQRPALVVRGEMSQVLHFSGFSDLKSGRLHMKGLPPARTMRIFLGISVVTFALYCGVQLACENNVFNSRLAMEIMVLPVVRSGQELTEFSTMNNTGLRGEPGKAKKRRFSTLPRSSNVTYNEMKPGEKYLLYSPSGGFNNQLISLAVAIEIAIKKNRTLLVPPAGRHSNMFAAYMNLRQIETIPMDHCLDFGAIGDKLGVKLLPLNVTIRKFYKEYLGGEARKPVESTNNTHVLHMDRLEKRTSGKVRWDILTRPNAHEQQVLWLFGPFYHATVSAFRVFAPKRRRRIMRKLYPAPGLIAFATRITDAAFGAGTLYNSMHVRLGDFRHKFKNQRISIANFLDLGLQWGWEKNQAVPIYVASEPGNDMFFQPLQKTFKNVARARDLLRIDRVNDILSEFSDSLPESLIRVDTYGIVEQIICARAQDFIGTKVSTFSQTIYILRVMPQFRHLQNRSQSVGLVTSGKLWRRYSAVLQGDGTTKIDEVTVGERDPDAW